MLSCSMHESASAHIEATPAAVFERVTEVARLPEWNEAITEVLREPTQLVPGSVWKVRLHALGQAWVSRSTLVELDTLNYRFRHRSQTDDSNPSYADWEWLVKPDGTGARLYVTVSIHPKTFWRKALLVHLRRQSLRKEMRRSLATLATTVSA
jgi:hypothetical protein